MGGMVISLGNTFSEQIEPVEDELGIPRVTLRQLIYFAAAARHGSALRAAEELNISPPAVSGAISGLESLLEQQLFIRRHARGLVLTDAGHHLLLEARGIIDRVREIESSRLGRSRKLRSQISLGCLGDIAPAIVPPLVRSFQARHPGVEVRWQTDSHPNLMARLEDGSVDLIFVLDFEISPTFHTSVLQATPIRCVLPQGHPLAKGPLSLQDLENEPFIMLDIPKTRDYFLSVFGDLGLQPKVTLRASSAEMVRSLVANGFGYSLLNFGAVERRDVVYLPLEGYASPSNLVAVRQYRRRPSPLIESFVTQAQEFIKQEYVNGALH